MVEWVFEAPYMIYKISRDDALAIMVSKERMLSSIQHPECCTMPDV